MEKRLNLILNTISLLLIVSSLYLFSNASNLFENFIFEVLFTGLMLLLALIIVYDLVRKISKPLTETMLNTSYERRLFFLSWINFFFLVGIYLSNFANKVQDSLSQLLQVYYYLVLVFVALMFLLLLLNLGSFQKQGKVNKFYAKDLFLRWSLFLVQIIFLLFTQEIVLFSQVPGENYMFGSFMFLFTTMILTGLYMYLLFVPESILFYLSFGKMHIGPKRNDYLAGLELSEQIAILDKRMNSALLYVFIGLDIIAILSFTALTKFVFLS